MFMFILMTINRIFRKVAQVRNCNRQETSRGRVTEAIDQLVKLLPGFENITSRDCERMANDLCALRTVFVSTHPAAECLALEAALVMMITVALSVLLCMSRPMIRWPQAVRLMARALDCRMTGSGVEQVTAELAQFTAEYEAIWNASKPEQDGCGIPEENGLLMAA